jgi:hypothetical protein
MGSFGSLQGKKSPGSRFFTVLSAKRNKLLGGGRAAKGAAFVRPVLWQGLVDGWMVRVF